MQVRSGKRLGRTGEKASCVFAKRYGRLSGARKQGRSWQPCAQLPSKRMRKTFRGRWTLSKLLSGGRKRPADLPLATRSSCQVVGSRGCLSWKKFGHSQRLRRER